VSEERRGQRGEDRGPLGAQPLITVDITCYREGEWPRECWESVLAKDDDRWGAVPVMDGEVNAATRQVLPPESP